MYSIGVGLGVSARKYTNKILEMHDEGMLHTEFLVRNLLMWMSEAEVKEFYQKVIELVDDENDPIN